MSNCDWGRREGRVSPSKGSEISPRLYWGKIYIMGMGVQSAAEIEPTEIVEKLLTSSTWLMRGCCYSFINSRVNLMHQASRKLRGPTRN